MRLIDADALKKAILAEPWKDQNNAVRLTVDYINIIIDEQPTVDAVPVVHGRWVWTETGEEDYEQYWACSKCGEHTYFITNYCPNCGARMDLKEESDA